MKKLAIYAMAVSAMMLAACGGQTSQSATDTDSDSVAVSFDQSQIEQKVMVELDSIAAQWNKLNPVEGVYANGKIQLSDDELKVKPDYLLSPDVVSNLTTNAQKYRALGMFSADLNVAKLYQMDESAIKGAVVKISADVSDPAFKEIVSGGTSEKVKAFYDAEKENGNLNMFWEASAGAIIENLYIVSQNADKLILAFDDQSASDFTLHISILKDAIDRLGAYDEDIKALSELLAPVNEINAISVDELKGQIEKVKPQIEASRDAFLK